MIIYLPFDIKGWGGIALFPFIFIEKQYKGNKKIINHEKIHIRQQLELLIVPFYLLYIGFYCNNRLKGMNHNEAYYNNPFEKEAYSNERKITYLVNRPFYKWMDYV